MPDMRINGARQLMERWRMLPALLRVALFHKCQDLAAQLQSHIQNDELDGQVLNARSGALRNSIQTIVDMDGNGPIVSVFSTGVKYALAQECGFQGTENVASFTREIKQAFGRAIEPKTVVVKSFTRSMTIPSHFYMGDGLADQRDAIIEALIATVKESITS